MTDKDFLFNNFDNLTEEKITLLPSDWAEQKRIIPEGLSPIPGPYSFKVNPYVKEIVDNFHPLSSVQEVAVMKGTQLCLTVGVLENIIGYSIGHDPAPMMMVTADQSLAANSIEIRIDAMIDSCGLRDKIFSQSKKKGNRSSGDTVKKKEFPGGFLVTASARSGGALRSLSVKKIFFDEIDGAPRELKTEGSYIDVAMKRTEAFEKSRKILYISTPLIKQTSQIWYIYLLGDQRKCFVPCLKCGEMQQLTFAQLKYKLDVNDMLIRKSVGIECVKCGHLIKDYDKVKFMTIETLEWRPTVKSKRPGLRSYHISSLYSPVEFRSWASIVQEKIEAERAMSAGNITKHRTYVNLTKGEPWEEKGEAPKWELIRARNSNNYKRGTVPDDVLFITIGADVQGDRVELEIVGWADDFRSYSIDYMVIKSHEEEREKQKAEIDNPNSNVWQRVEDVITGQYPYVNKAGSLNALAAFIDSRYKGPVVREFCRRLNGVFPIYGDDGFRKWKNVFIPKQIEGNLIRYDLYVDALKDQFYSQLKKGEKEDGSFPSGYCHFPEDYESFYYKMLTAEEKRIKTNQFGRVNIYWHKPDDRRNEALDCRVYALAAVHVMAENICCQGLKLDNTIWFHFWDFMKKQSES